MSSNKQTFGFTTIDFASAQRIGQHNQINNFVFAPSSTFGQSCSIWKFPTTYTAVSRSNFGAFESTFGKSNPGWTFESK